QDGAAMSRKSGYSATATKVDRLDLTYAGMVDGSDASATRSNGTSGSKIKPAVSKGRSASVSDAWSKTGSSEIGTTPSKTAFAQAPLSATPIVGQMHTVSMNVIAPDSPTRTFPVLAHWQFTCKGNRDFQSLMQGLDVGMLGTLRKPPDPVKPGGKPLPPPSRQPPEVVDTGHIALQQVSRAGEPTTIWYRGPLVPR